MKKGVTILLILIIILVATFYILTRKPETINYEDRVKQEALKLYNQVKESGIEFSSQCLGNIVVYRSNYFVGIFKLDSVDYVVDIVHVPRIAEDDLLENQCQDYREGKIIHFVELDKDGNVVRII